MAATHVPRSPRRPALPWGMRWRPAAMPRQALLPTEGKRVGVRPPLKRWWLEDGARRGLDRPRSAPALRPRPEQRRQDRGAQRRCPEDAEEPDKERRKDLEARKQRRGEQARASPGEVAGLMQLLGAGRPKQAGGNSALLTTVFAGGGWRGI